MPTRLQPSSIYYHYYYYLVARATTRHQYIGSKKPSNYFSKSQFLKVTTNFSRYHSQMNTVNCNKLYGRLVTPLKPGFHTIDSDVRIVSVTDFGRLSQVSINSSLSKDVLSSARDDHMETLLRLFQTILTSEVNRSSR